MGKNVFANDMEIAHKAGSDGKVMGAFPDVCLSAPPPPTGPVPVPYPNSSFTKDLQDGSATVFIGGKPLALKDQSFLKTSPLGDEAATRNFGGSVLTHTIAGKTYFQAYSMDVKVEGKNVCRHLDITTSNHASYPGGTPPFPKLSRRRRKALARVKQGQCPCCRSTDCPAAFKEGEEPLSMEEALQIDPRAPKYNSERAEYYKLLRGLKKKTCTCTGQVFPRPPCDVFRARKPTRTEAIDNKWTEKRNDYVEWYERKYGVALKGKLHFYEKMMAERSQADQDAIQAIGKLTGEERTAALETEEVPGEENFAKTYYQMHRRANNIERINHLTPKEYGGCPTSQNNLQPQQTLCQICQDMDQFMTDGWEKKVKKRKGT